MSTRENDLKHCEHLLDYFDAVELGEGDLTAGANVLAAMLLSLASLRRPGSTVQCGNGTAIPVQGGCLVTGAHSSCLVTDIIVSTLRQFQSSVTTHNYQWHRSAENGPESVTREPSGKPLIERMAKIDDDVETLESCGQFLLLTPPAWQLHWELRNRPLFFASAASPRDIERYMPLGNSGRLFMHVPLNNISDFSDYSGLATRLLDGCNASLGLQFVRGEIIATDTSGNLGAAVQTGDPRIDWLVRMPWLVEKCSEDRFPATEKRRPRVLQGVASLYRQAVESALGKRLSVRDPRVEALQFNIPQIQRQWIGFLSELDPAWPGICGNLRHLPASLFLGMMELLRVAGRLPRSGRPDGTEESVQILACAFARQLVRRMVCYRQSQLRDHHLYQLSRLADWVQTILAEGPMSVRDITRRRHRLPAERCREALEFLESNGAVAQDRNGWSLTKTNKQSECHVTA